MPGRRDPWRWAAASLIAVSALVVVLVTVGGGGASPRDVRTSATAVPLLLDHLAARLAPSRGDAAMAFDSRRDEVVLYGGDPADNPSAPPLTDTWVLKGRRWTQRHPPSHPPAMSDELMVPPAGPPSPRSAGRHPLGEGPASWRSSEPRPGHRHGSGMAPPGQGKPRDTRRPTPR